MVIVCDISIQCEDPCKMVNLCAICTSRDSLKPLSDEHRGVLETLISRDINLWELRHIKLLVCSACVSLIQSLAQFRNRAIDGVKHLLLLSQNQLIEPEEVYIKGEPPNIGKSVDAFIEIEPELQCVTDTFKEDIEKAQVSSQTTLISQSANTAVFTHSKMVQSNGITQNQTANIAAHPKIELVPQNRLVSGHCPPVRFFDPPQFLPNPYYSLHMPICPPAQMQPVNAVMPLHQDMARKGKAPRPIAPKLVEERSPEARSDNNNPLSSAGEVTIKPHWFTQVVSNHQMLMQRAYERARPEFADAPYKCKTCILLFGSQEEMEAHAKEHVLASDDLPCKACAMPVRTSDEEAHLAKHATRLQCARCAFSTEQLSVIEAHDCSSQPVKKKYYRRCRRKYDNTFQCVLCRTKYIDQAGLDRHNERAHKNPEDFKCNVCSNEFAGKIHLYQHKRSVHKAKDNAIDALRPELYCVECNKAFATASQYRQHRMTRKHCPEESLQKFECDLCKKTFTAKGEVASHIQWTHVVEEPVACTECGRSLPNQLQLRKHMERHERARTWPRPHVCHVCGKGFTIKKSLDEHVLSHSGLRPHKCPLCPATFTYKAALFTHNRLKHLKIKGNWKRTKKDKS